MKAAGWKNGNNYMTGKKPKKNIEPYQKEGRRIE